MSATSPTPDSDDALNAQAGLLMKGGLALLEENTPAALREAVGCFDAAIKLRSQLPLSLQPFFRYGLCAGWLNRGDALTRLGGAKNLAAAVRSHDEAIAHLFLLPLDQSPLFRRRFAIAWLNRGLALQELGRVAEALLSFDRCLELLREEHSPAVSDRREILGCGWLNRSMALLRLEAPAARASKEAALQALDFLSAQEENDIVAAEASLKARRAFCQAAALLMDECDDRVELAAQATDAAESGLELIRRWKERGRSAFQSLGRDLFRFGLKAYQLFQPQFLPEFVVENLESGFWSDEMQHEAMAALHGAFRSLRSQDFATLAGPGALDRLRQLAEAEARLEAAPQR